MTALQHLRTAPASPGPASPALSVEGARVWLGGQEILRGSGFTVPAGRTLALLGPSGCGKTTLLRSVAGLQDLDEGTIRLADRDLAGVPAERRGVGMVFQDGALFPHLSVSANVAFGLSRRHPDRAAAVAEALDLVGLVGLTNRMPSTLSGGQQQRVALARALVAEPDVLLLDEPFSSLDTGLRAQVRADVANLLADLQITAVVVTHDQEEAFLLGHEVAVMIGGRIHQQASPSAIYAAPASREVAQFLGEANLVSADATGSTATTWLGPVPIATGMHGEVEVLMRPEHLRMARGGPLTVQSVEYYGHDALTRLTGPWGHMIVRTMSMPPFVRGDDVGVSYDGPPTMAYSI